MLTFGLMMIFLGLCISLSAQDNITTIDDVLSQELIESISEKRDKTHYDAPSDSSYVKIRLISVARLDKFRNDSEFNYARDTRHEKTF